MSNKFSKIETLKNIKKIPSSEKTAFAKSLEKALEKAKG